MSEVQKSPASAPAETLQTSSGLLDQIVEEGRLARDPSVRERSRDLVKEFVAQVLEGSMAVSKDTEAMINARIAQIDHLLSTAIQRDPAPRRISEAWKAAGAD